MALYTIGEGLINIHLIMSAAKGIQIEFCFAVFELKLLRKWQLFLRIIQINIHKIGIYYIYYTTLLKSVQITRKTSTNIQRYSDSWLFVYFRFDEFVFSQSNFVSGAVLHVC